MSGRERRLLFLYGTPNLLGSALGLAGLGLYFTGVIRAYWLVIVIGLYVLGFVVAPRNRAGDLIVIREQSLSDLPKALEKLVASINKRVPKEVLDKVVSIKSTIDGMLPALAEDGEAAYHTHLVKQTALEYLPEALEHYLKLPPAFAKMHTLENGQTAEKLLLEQLSLLDDTMQRVGSDVYRKDTKELEVHGRFLQEKFGKSELQL